MKIYVDAYFAKNLGDDLFVNILTKRYPNHKFYAIAENEKGYSKDNLKVYSNKYFFKVLKKFQLEKYLANRYDTVVTIGGSMFMEKNDADREYIYNLIFEGTKQFLNNNYLNNDKPYDAYTSKVLGSAKCLLDKYRVKSPITIPVDYQSIDFANDFVNDYNNKRIDENHYLYLRFHYSNFLRNPSTFDLSTLMKIVNDENIVVYKKYFEGILNERLEAKRRRYRR